MLAQAKDDDGLKLGENIITGGLVIQVLFFAVFVIVAAVFHYRMRWFPSARSQTVKQQWERYLFVLYAASGLILIRSIFRIVEYVQGQDGALLETETYLYVFDSTLMFSTMVLFNIFHPSSIISSHSDEENITYEGTNPHGSQRLGPGSQGFDGLKSSYHG
jgi:tellurite resistance protein TehA-like permease